MADAETVASRLGQFIAGVRYEDVPADVLDRAKRSTLDLLGVALCGSRSESAAEFGGYVDAQRAVGESSIVGAGGTTAFYAALANATFAHATELSETFNRAVVHPGNVVIPAALAVAERERRGGAALLTSIAVGYEVLVRVGLTLGPRWMMDQGYHPPSALGPFGSVAAAASLCGLNPGQAANALGSTACLTPSTLAAAFGGATIKELFEGYAAAVGIMTCDLARMGVTGPADWPTEWYRAVARQHDPAALTDRLGEFWHVGSGGLRFKVRAVAAMATPALDAVQSLLTDPANASIDAGRIRSVRVESARRVHIGAERRPPTLVAARASVPFLVAYALCRQPDFLGDPHLVRALTAESLADPDVLALASAVELVVDETIDREFEEGWPPRFAARVVIDTGDATVERYHDSFPATSNLPFDQVADKFRNVSADVLDPVRQDAVIDMVAKLDDLDDVASLTALLRASR